MMDDLTRLSQEAINRRALVLDKQFTLMEKDQLKKMLAEAPTGFIIPLESPIKELKHKKGVPTVIEYQGKRYILDMKG